MREHKKLKSVYFVWIFINAFWLIAGIAQRGALFKIPEDYTFYNENAGEIFFPEGSGFIAYDISEFFLYVGFPILIYWLYRYNTANSKQ